LARTLDQQIDFPGFVSLGQFYRRDFYIQAIGLAALDAFEMNVLMAVLRCGTGFRAKGVFEGAGVIQDLMYQSPVVKGFKRAVYRNAVDILINFTFNVAVRERILLFQKKMQYLLPRRGRPQPETFQEPV